MQSERMVGKLSKDTQIVCTRSLAKGSLARLPFLVNRCSIQALYQSSGPFIWVCFALANSEYALHLLCVIARAQTLYEFRRLIHTLDVSVFVMIKNGHVFYLARLLRVLVAICRCAGRNQRLV